MIVAAVSEDEEGDFEWGGEGVLASILPVRAEFLAGDLRALYLLWLLSVQVGEVADDAVEPPVPASLDALTGSQTALVEFLRIDRDLVDGGRGRSPTGRASARVDVARWVAGLRGGAGRAVGRAVGGRRTVAARGDAAPGGTGPA